MKIYPIVLGLLVMMGGMAHAQKAANMPQHKPKSSQKKSHKIVFTEKDYAKGLAFHLCSCAVPCPCMINDKDIEGCNIVRVYHFTAGGIFGKQVIGQTILVIPVPDALKKDHGIPKSEGSPIDSLIYFSADPRSDTGHSLMGAYLEMQSGLPGNMLFRKADIRFAKTATGYEVTVPGTFHAVINKLVGANDKQVIFDNLSLGEGSKWYIGRTKVHTWQAKETPEWHWNEPNANGSWTQFRVGPHIDPSDE